MITGKRLLVLLLVLALVVGTWPASVRYLQENSNRKVELAVDARLLNDEGSEDFDRGYPPREKLLELQEAGCTAIAVAPLSLNDLEKTGELVSLTPTLYLVRGGKELGEQLQAALSLLLPGVECKKVRMRPKTLAVAGGKAVIGGAPTAEYQTLSLPARFVPAVKELPLILPRERLIAWHRAGLRIVPLFNYPARLSPRLGEKYWEVLARQLRDIKRTGRVQFGAVAFPAASFNYPAPQGAAGSIFWEEGFSLGAAEFTQGRGLRKLAAALDYRLHRVHQIPAAELAQLGEKEARERFLRAVQERKVRLLLLQPFPELDPRSEWGQYLPLIQDLSGDLRAAGFHPGVASFYPFYRPPAAVEALLGAGLAAAAILLAGFFLNRNGEKTAGKLDPLLETAPRAPLFRRPVSRFYPLAGIVFILATAGFLFAGERLPFYILGRQLAALAAALIFPLLATLYFLEPPLRTPVTSVEVKNGDALQHKNYLKKLVRGFIGATLLTTGGAILAAGLLGSTPFLLKIESFRGVKIAQAGPFLLFGLWFLLQSERGLWRAGRDFLEARLQVKHLVLLALAGGLLLIYLLRGGNASILPVSGWELALRRHLEILLVARPRFKEFLIGHPGYFFFAALAARRWRGTQTIALLLGLLGQISLFNTFMHLHRPVGLSLLGTVYGAGLGLLGGLALYYLPGAIARRAKQRAS